MNPRALQTVAPLPDGSVIIGSREGDRDRMLVDKNPSDFHFLTWGADGGAIGFGYGLDTSLWRFTPRIPSRAQPS